MLRLLSAILTIAIILAGCNQDSTTQVTSSGPAVEPPDITSKEFGDYVIYFNAISTDLLPSEVARTYNIARSKNRVLLNVSITRKIEGEMGQPISGDINVTANNLTGQVKNLVLREIQEGDAIYYIGDIPVANAETLVFTLGIKPVNETAIYTLRFSRQFFSD